jgi:hypothetical protein
VSEHQVVRVVLASKNTGRACRSCGAALTFYTTASGRQMPFTGDPVAEGETEGLFGPTGMGLIAARHAHHATCPGAADWRKG